MRNEETEKNLKRLEKQLVKCKNEHQEAIKTKNKEIKMLSQKLSDAERTQIYWRQKASAALQVKIVIKNNNLYCF